MKISLISAVVPLAALVGSAVPSAAMSPFESHAVLTPRSQIDKLVLGRLEQLGIQPANICSDAVFVRRVYLDVIGTLPTAQQARTFILDKDPNKRGTLIDRLLEREEFADYWAMKWSDLLRVKAEFPINLWPNAVQTYHRWIRDCIKENMPYDRFVRELLTASGSNFRVPQVNFYRAIQSKEPQAIAQAVALTFMGVRAENWEKNRLSGMAAFFSQVKYKQTAEWKEEIVCFDPNKAAAPATGGAAMAAIFPDGTPARLSPGQDPREVFANWLIAPKNPWFTRNIANRVWSWLLGRGIIHEPDDIRPDNPPSNPELLAFLEQQLIAAHYDLKHLYRLILNSNTYQLSSIPRTNKPEGKANFSHYSLRRLEAEIWPLISTPQDFNHFRRTYGLEVFWKPVPHDDIIAQDKDMAKQIAEPVLQSIFGQMPEPETAISAESVFYALDLERGQQTDLSAGIPLVRSVEHLHQHNGIPIVGDILSVAVAGNEIVKIRACWHKIVREQDEQRREVVDAEESLGVAAGRFAQKFPSEKELRFTLRGAKLCYYGFHDAGKSRKIFVSAWHFTFEKDGKLYQEYINAHTNQAIDFEVDIANAMRKQKK